MVSLTRLEDDHSGATAFTICIFNGHYSKGNLNKRQTLLPHID